MSIHDQGPEFEGRPELVRLRARAILIRRAMIGAVALFMVATLCLLAYNALQSIRTRTTLLDCTTPTGECSQQSQQRSEEAILRLLKANTLDELTTRRIILLAAACADETQSQSVVQIEACVNEKLRKGEQLNLGGGE